MAEHGKRPATYADIEAAPEHLVAEIIFGELMTHPRPSFRHGSAASALSAWLGARFQFGDGEHGDDWIFIIEQEIKFGGDILVPDIAGWRRRRLTTYPDKNYVTVAPDWICEVLSGSTEKRDRTLKMRIYGETGVLHMWLIDPRLQIVEAFKNEDRRWTKIGDWNSSDEARIPPFDSFSLSLADLWPLDKPLGFNEDPTPYYAGDR